MVDNGLEGTILEKPTTLIFKGGLKSIWHVQEINTGTVKYVNYVFYIKDETDAYITGALNNKEIAEHIVNLHNEHLIKTCDDVH